MTTQVNQPRAHAATSARVRRGCIVGIDPGTVTGFAAYDVAERCLTAVTSASFFDVCAMLRALHEGEGVALCVVEDSRSLPIYARNRGARGQALAAIGRSVGVTDRDTGLWLDLCDRMGIPSRAATPGKRRKWKAADLEQITGYEGRTNEHARDAARLAWEHRHHAPARPSFSTLPCAPARLQLLQPRVLGSPKRG